MEESNDTKGAGKQTFSGGRKISKLNTYQKSEMMNKVIDWSLAGIGRLEIRELIKENAQADLSDSNCDSIIDHAKQVLEETVLTDARQIIAIHIGWYEKAYQYFFDIEHAEGMNKAMKAKERLVGLLQKENKLVVNKKTSVILSREIAYDTGKLSANDKGRLEELINKAK